MDKPYEYIEKLYDIVKEKLYSPESAMTLNRMYDNTYINKQNIVVENALGPVLYRKEESIENTSSYRDLVLIYVNLSIYKHFGLNLAEYLNLTSYARDTILEIAKELQDKAVNEMDELENEMDILKNSIPKE